MMNERNSSPRKAGSELMPTWPPDRSVRSPQATRHVGGPLAAALRAPRHTLWYHCQLRASGGADPAWRLARLFRASPEFLMRLQATHDPTTAQPERGRAI